MSRIFHVFPLDDTAPHVVPDGELMDATDTWAAVWAVDGSDPGCVCGPSQHPSVSDETVTMVLHRSHDGRDRVGS